MCSKKSHVRGFYTYTVLQLEFI